MSSTTTIEATWKTRRDGVSCQSSHLEFPPFALLAPGDSVIWSMGHLEQVSALNSFAANTAGTSITRTATFEFRWKNQGGNFSAWLAPTPPNLSGAAVNKDLPLYVEIRATRGGADNTGFIEIHSLILGHTIDPLAAQGFGKFSLATIRTDVTEFWVSLLQSWSIQYGGADHYKVKYEPRLWVTETKHPIIYLHTLERIDSNQIRPNRTELNYTMRVGIKPLATVGKTYQYSQMLDRLQNVFDPTFGTQARHTFEFKGTQIVGASLRDLGVTLNQNTGDTEFHDSETMSIYNEFTANFAINYIVLPQNV